MCPAGDGVDSAAMFLPGFDDVDDKEKMTKGFEAFFQTHNHENNNSPPWVCDDYNPFPNIFMKSETECKIFGEGVDMAPVGKFVDIDDFSYDIKTQNWRKKQICQWHELDVMKWIIDTCNLNNLKCEDIDLSKFKMKGDTLYNMSKTDFEQLNKKYGGILFNQLLELRNEREHSASSLITLKTMDADQFPLLGAGEVAYPQLNGVNQKGSSPTFRFDSDTDNNVLPQHAMGATERRPVGRPKGQNRRRSAKKFGRLWEFIRDMLHDPIYCPSIIRWVDHDKGLFKFERSDAVARVWGNRKKNPKMNYEKLSRAMRYYYKSKVFMAVEHQRLVYRFGPNAKGWQTDDPNFEKQNLKL